METPAADEHQVTQQPQEGSQGATSITEILANQAPLDPHGEGGEDENNQNTPNPIASEEGAQDGTPADPGAVSGENGGEGGQAEPTENTNSDGESGQGEEEGEVITSWSQLVDHQEWDPEWADNLKVTTVVNGETRERTIGELKRIDQTVEAADQRLTDAKAKSQEIHQEALTQREQAAMEVAGAASLVNLAEKLIQLDEGRLAELKDTDNQAYLVLKDEIREKKEAINQVRGVTQNAMREVLAQITQGPNQMSEEERTELAREEHNKLIEAIPEWQGEENQERAQQESADLVKHAMNTYGFSEQEISEVMDHRIFRLARDAMLYRRQEGAAEAARDKVLKIPRIMPGGAQQDGDKKSKADPNRPKSNILYPSK